ncbi:MAG TPA: pyruvate kinase [Methyloceanibacter sp.]|nr:pyruvate kinase [Methyloceanibacter sp.]
MSDGRRLHSEAKELLEQVIRLRADVAAGGKAIFRDWRPRLERRPFAMSALNLAHYLALRGRDLRPLQRGLMALGLSSLGRAEGRVLATLDSVTVALAAQAGLPQPVRMPSSRQFFRGEARLKHNTEVLFGPSPQGRCGRILVTLDTAAAEDPTLILRLAEHGADAVRINCAHDDAAHWRRMITHVRAAEAKLGRRIRVLMDIAGPKIRTRKVVTPPDRSELRIGDELLLVRDKKAAGIDDVPFRTRCTQKNVLDHVKVGDPVSIDDGKLKGTIVRETDAGLVARMNDGRLKGMKLKPEKSINFPGVDLGLDPLTDQDRQDLEFIVRHADMIGYSFVENAEDVAFLQDELADRRADWQKLALIAKIETPRAVHNLPEIIVQGAARQPFGVMIARGDLAVEMGFLRVAEMQEEILWICEAAHVPAIWATQVLEDLVKTGLPSRGEMTDAAMAARAECVMLNKGENIVAGVDALCQLLCRMGEHQVKKTPTLRALHAWAD